MYLNPLPNSKLAAKVGRFTRSHAQKGDTFPSLPPDSPFEFGGLLVLNRRGNPNTEVKLPDGLGCTGLCLGNPGRCHALFSKKSAQKREPIFSCSSMTALSN